VGAVGGLGMEGGAGVAVREVRRRRGWRGWRRGRGCSPFLLVAGSGGLENRDQVEWRGGERNECGSHGSDPWINAERSVMAGVVVDSEDDAFQPDGLTRMVASYYSIKQERHVL